jgi:hypothetical protein
MSEYKRGDKVAVDTEGESGREVFDAIVLKVSHDQSEPAYHVIRCGTGSECAWWSHKELTFISHVGEKAIKRLADKREKLDAERSDMEWIWKNWNTIRENPPTATMTALIRQVGIEDPWSRGEYHGEWMIWHDNAAKTFAFVDPPLSAGDRKAFAKVCQTLRSHFASRSGRVRTC